MFVITVLIALIIPTTFAIEPCQTPNGQNGDCQPINQCTLLYSHIQSGSVSFDTSEYLRKTVCGFMGRYPKVCCPLGSSLPPKSKPVENLIVTSDLLPNSSFCGLESNSNEFPWVTLLEYRSRSGNMYFGCTGVLINRRYVLTARHCLISTLVRVRLGEYNTETDPDGNRAPAVVKIRVKKTIHHHEPSSDVGLIRLSKEADYSDFIKPICLPLATDDLNKSYEGQKFLVAGWGLAEKRVQSKIRLKVQMSVRPTADCEMGTTSSFTNKEKPICAGGAKGGDSCIADSGGPLMGSKSGENGVGRWYAFGIVSFGSGNPCGSEGRPALYVRIAQYVSWVVQNLEP